MNLESRKLVFIEEFLKIESEALLTRLEKMILKEKISSDKEELSPMSTEEFNIRIDRAIDDSKNGRLIHADEMKSMIEKWN